MMRRRDGGAVGAKTLQSMCGSSITAVRAAIKSNNNSIHVQVGSSSFTINHYIDGTNGMGKSPASKI
jgi:hypothetical protein